MRFGSIILAAGASSRMGRPKLLLPWGPTTVLGQLISQWQRLRAEQIAVVCATGDQGIEHELDRLGFPAHHRITNSTPQLGMFSSIQCAARWPGWSASLSHWIIILGDQPHLSAITLRALIDFSVANPEKICQPSRNGRPRHPVFLPKDALERLRKSSEDNLKSFLETLSPNRALCEIDDPGLDLDIDHPADYEKAIQFFSSQMDS